MKRIMRYFGFISLDEISEIYQSYAKEQERLKNDPRFKDVAQAKANAAFEIWTKITDDKK